MAAALEAAWPLMKRHMTVIQGCFVCLLPSQDPWLAVEAGFEGRGGAEFMGDSMIPKKKSHTSRCWVD